MRRRTTPPRPPAGPPTNAEDGAARVRAALVKLFDRQDGTGADWRLLLESLYRAGFGIADQWPDEEGRRSIMRRVHAQSYKRAVGEAEESNSVPAGPVQAPSITGVFKSSHPKLPR